MKKRMPVRRGWALALLVVMASCRQGAGDGTAPDAEGPAKPTAAPKLPIAEPPMNREALLLAVARATSAAASGTDDTAAQRTLRGKQFEFRMRFGCAGETAPHVPGRWTFDEARRVLRIEISPDLELDDVLLAGLAEGEVEAVDGFYVRRPWQLTAACPAQPPTEAAGEGNEGPPPGAKASEKPAAPTATAKPRLAIAQLYTLEDSRTHRRNRRAYESTMTLAPSEAPSALGYDLVLAGRLTAMPSGRVIACRVTAASEPPACVVSAEFANVRLEAADGTRIAEWIGG